MNLKKFQSWTIWIMVGKVDGIAMSKTSSGENLSGVVESGRTPYYFIASVAIDITNGDVMVAITIHSAATAS